MSRPAFDRPRLATLLHRVRHAMIDGTWRTLRELSDLTGGSEAGVSARLRELRRLDAAGKLWPRKIADGYQVDRRRRDSETGGLFEYRVRLPIPGPIQSRLFEGDGSPGKMSPTELRRISSGKQLGAHR